MLLLGIAAVLAGLTATLAMLGIAYSPFVLLAAIPTGAAAYFLWYQASGRLKEDMRSRAAGRRAASRAGEGAPGGTPGSPAKRAPGWVTAVASARVARAVVTAGRAVAARQAAPR